MRRVPLRYVVAGIVLYCAGAWTLIFLAIRAGGAALLSHAGGGG